MFSRTVYMKGALVLHMLRWELGDTDFLEGLQTYYERFKYQSVHTSDFVDVMEEVSGRDLEGFFQGWIYGVGWPQYEISSYTDTLKDGSYQRTITVHQHQDDSTVFAMTLPIDPDGDGPLQQIREEVKGRWHQFSVTVPDRSGNAEIIETNWLLMDTRKADYPAPAIKKIRKGKLRAGKLNKVKVYGSNFTPVTKVELDSENVILKSVNINNSGTIMTLRIRVPRDARREKFGLKITNPDGDSDSRSRGLKIVPKK
jgi:hypothetical protein